jgi:hypothetical protein
MTYRQSNLAFADGIQELSFDEIDFVSGGVDAYDSGNMRRRPEILHINGDVANRIGEYVGAAVSAACGYFAKSLGKAIGCAVAGEAAKDLVVASKDYMPTDPMDKKLGIKTGR